MLAFKNGETDLKTDTHVPAN